MKTELKICGKLCTDYDETALLNAGIIICETPEFDENTMVSPCTIEFADLARGKRKTPRNFNFNFDAGLTPEVTSLSHKKGGTAGGTTLTITGSGFGSDPSKIVVTISDTTINPKITTGDCIISSATDNQIVCVTSAATKGTSKPKYTPIEILYLAVL